MRRILAIVIIGLIVFLGIYGIMSPVKAAVDGFMLNTIGPTAFNMINNLYLLILTTVGVAGFAAIVLGFGFIFGMIAHFLWVKADWRLRRWGHTRTAKDLGATPVSHVRSTTPVDATARPPITASAPVEAEASAETETKESEGV